jgi:HSP20 family protein
MANLELWRNNFGPFRDMMTFGKAFDRMLEDWPAARADVAKYNFNPSCEVKEDKAAYMLKVDLPGVPKDAIKVDLHDNRLTITGERTEEKKTDEKEKDTKTHFSEMFYGSFTRTMTFPVPVDAERTEARFEHGVLTMTIPKKVAQNAREISIK